MFLNLENLPLCDLLLLFLDELVYSGHEAAFLTFEARLLGFLMALACPLALKPLANILPLVFVLEGTKSQVNFTRSLLINLVFFQGACRDIEQLFVEIASKLRFFGLPVGVHS